MYVQTVARAKSQLEAIFLLAEYCLVAQVVDLCVSLLYPC